MPSLSPKSWSVLDPTMSLSQGLFLVGAVMEVFGCQGIDRPNQIGCSCRTIAKDKPIAGPHCVYATCVTPLLFDLHETCDKRTEWET